MRRVVFISSVLLGLLVVLPSASRAQAPVASAAAPAANLPPGEGQKRAQATRVANGRITLDGRLDESDWAAAPAADRFWQQQPREGAGPSEGHQSAVRFLYDDEYLYIGATFEEAEPGRLVVNELKRDFNARDGDLYVVVLDTFLDKLNAYAFQTNPACAIRDTQSYDDGRTINANWDGVWFCRSTVQGTTWYVEQAVPFKQLRFPRKDEQTWGLQIYRLVRHSNEQLMWNPTPRQFNQFKTSYAGILDGIRGVQPGRNIRIKPFVTGLAQSLGGRRNSDADGGLDMKVGLGTNLVLDGTWRTDFSQVEADTQQVNLTRFSLFFPEKREFFLENQGAFQIGPPASSASNLVPFFSRTIGLGDTGTPVPIVGGLRLTGKVGRNSVALLNMQTEEEVRGATTLPSANYSVFRYGREFLRNSSAGLFYLGKARGGVDNQLVGADLRFYPTRQWNIDAMVMHSERTGTGGGDAWRGGVQYDAGLTQYTVNYTSLGRTFKDELGFVPREGVDILNAGLLQRLRPKRLEGRSRELGPQVNLARYTRGATNPQTGGRIGVETQTLTPQATVEFSNASTADVTVVRDEELLIAPFRPQGIPAGRAIAPGRYTFTATTLTYTGSNSQRLAPTGAFRTGQYYDGTRTGFTAGARLRVSAKFATTLSVSQDQITLPNGVSFDTTLSSLRVDTSFSTRMFLNAFVQYNSVTKQVSSNVRYDLIHHPLSDVYLVYNDAHFVDITRPTAAQQPSRALILKVTHLLSF